MDDATREGLVALVRGRGLASLGTLEGGSPLVSLVLYACTPDLSALYIHVSRLAQHTAAMLANPRVGLLIVEHDLPSRNPLSLARVSIQAEASRIDEKAPESAAARDLYLAAHPTAAVNFQLGDFLLFRLCPRAARFVAGFGRIHDLNAQAWAALATEQRR